MASNAAVLRKQRQEMRRFTKDEGTAPAVLFSLCHAEGRQAELVAEKGNSAARGEAAELRPNAMSVKVAIFSFVVCWRRCR